MKSLVRQDNFPLGPHAIQGTALSSGEFYPDGSLAPAVRGEEYSRDMRMDGNFEVGTFEDFWSEIGGFCGDPFA